ncbi:hypothetical protein C6P40_001943 [Pichia californica]|uniref:Mannosyltransferase n=1 Tax=Pichia californica TaxID=460514 RepID=A0A9P6WKG1_9ASCO|nr:hypothetical protein C6P42_001919 [[Candida] californica]KAG0687742.1 hypothetical protein C6P40_001943 [[Candida] californica]
MIRIPKKITRLLVIIFSITSFIYLYHGIILPSKSPINFKFNYYKDIPRDQIVEENYEKLVSILKTPINEPKTNNLIKSIDNPSDYKLENATLMIMARNSELNGVIYTIKQIEEKFNSKFNYPYVFLNNEDFNLKFKEKIKKFTKSNLYFEKIQPEIWNQPNWINKERQKNEMKLLKNQNIAYANKLSYHNMCRFYSMNFYNHPRMKQFKYYWRFEPNTDYFCNIDYDVFKFMELNNKIYGFVISLYDSHQSIKSLWTETINFLNLNNFNNKNLINSNAAINFLTENLQNPEKTKFTNGYSTCHFWSNFEIGNMDFFRSNAYNSWVNYLDSTGGFYYERWGDAPVHSIGVSLFANKNDIHWFRDIGYKHHPYTNCPNSNKCNGCEPGKFTFDNLKDQNCLTNWWNFEMDDSAKQIY